jgi:hypothetical protein
MNEHDVIWRGMAAWLGADYISGLGQFRAGRGRYVTDWHPTQTDAAREFVLLH